MIKKDMWFERWAISWERFCLMVRQCHVIKTTVAGVRHCAFVISLSGDSVLPFLCVCSMRIDVQVWGRYICIGVCMCVEATHRSVPTMLYFLRPSGTIVIHLQNTGRLGVCHCFLVSCWESTMRSSRQTLCQQSHPPVLGTSSGVIPQS